MCDWKALARLLAAATAIRLYLCPCARSLRREDETGEAGGTCHTAKIAINSRKLVDF